MLKKSIYKSLMYIFSIVFLYYIYIFCKPNFENKKIILKTKKQNIVELKV